MGNNLKVAQKWLNDFIGMIYPRVCDVCGTSLVADERILCTSCNLSMPRTNYHLRTDFTDLNQRLTCHYKIERVASMFHYFHDSPYGQLIQKLKYNRRTDIGKELGFMYAKELTEEGFFNGITMLVPIPVSRMKRITRGYNQAEMIAKGISNATGIEIGNYLIAERSHSTQTKKNKAERWENSAGIYRVVNAEKLTGQHVLIIDDVITTGSTMIRCCEAIKEAEPTCLISVLSLGSTKLQ